MAKKTRGTQKKRAGGAQGAQTERSAHGPSAEGDGVRIPRWVPGVVFVAVAVALFRDFVFSDRMLFGNDTLGLGYVARAWYAEALSGGSVPGWAPLILGGTPFLEALASGDSLYPPSVLLLALLEPYRALGWKLVLHFVAAGFFTFGWLRAIGASRPAALLGGTAYMLAPYFVSLVQPGHDGKIFVTALAPLLFWAVHRHFDGPGVRSVVSTALVIGLVLLTTHFQMAYFLFGAVGTYAIFRSVELWRAAERVSDDPDPGQGAPPTSDAPRGALRRPALAGAVPFGLFLGASLLGAGVAAVQLLPAVDYVTEYSRRVQTTREAAGESGAAWSSSWSLHPEDVVGLVVPEFSGNNAGGADWSQGTYWGRNFHKDNHESTGLVILLLAGVSFVGGARRSLRFFLAGLGLVALLFALGAHTPLWGFFYAAVPGISLFRAPSQVMFLFAFAAVTLGALGLDRLLELSRAGDRAAWRPVLKVLGVAAGALFVLAFLAGSGMLTSFWTRFVYTPPQPDIVDSLEPFIARGAGLAFLFGLLTLAVAWAMRSGLVTPAVGVGALLLLVAVDEGRIGSGFVQTLDFAEWSAPDGFTRAVMQREAESGDPYRLLSFRNAGQDVMPALQGIELAAGHHPNDLSRYRELIGMVGSGMPQNLLDADLRRLLNVRYVLWPEYQAGGRAFGPPETVLARSELPNGVAFESLHVELDLPRARLVGASVVKTDAEAVEYMLSDAFDPETEVVLAEAAPVTLDGAPAEGTVEWVERAPDRLELRVSTARPALLVVADNWFPAWRATVDGADAPLLRAYHTLRAVPVPAGDHSVEMVYRSSVVRRSLMLSIVVTLALVGALGVRIARERLGRES